MKRLIVSTFLFLFCLVPFACEDLEKIQTAVSEGDITAGLREALSIGATRAGSQLSEPGGYFSNAALKILLPADANALITKAYDIPFAGVAAKLALEPLITAVVEKMNAGAEDAAKKAAPIFVSAITSMTVTDGRNILLGEDSAATNYLRVKTFSPLTNAFAPKIDSAMEKVGAATAWNTLFSTYNSYVSLAPASLKLTIINPNLGQYATEKALNGLFKKVSEEEKQIRDNPAQRTTDLLKRVFKLQDPE